jgi:hypothetical protein
MMDIALKAKRRGVVVVLEVAYLGCSDIDTDESSHFRSPNKTSSKGRRGWVHLANSFLSQHHEQVLRPSESRSLLSGTF